MKVIKHNDGGYLLEPRLLGRLEFLVDHLKSSGAHGHNDPITNLVLDRVLDGFKQWPPAIVHTAESLELNDDPA